MTEKHWGYYKYFSDDPLMGEAITKLGNCRCGQVFMGQRPRRKMLPHKPAEYDSCYWADVPTRTRTMTEAKRECCDTAINEYHLADCQRPGKGEPFDGSKRTWCCQAMVLDPHAEGCEFEPRPTTGKLTPAKCEHKAGARHPDCPWCTDPVTESLFPSFASRDAMNTAERTILRAEDSMQADYEQDHAEWLARHNMVEDASLPPGIMVRSDLIPKPGEFVWNDYRNRMFIRGRGNGKQAEFERRSAELAQYFAPEQVVDHDRVIGYYAKPSSGDVDRTFENEVRLHVDSR